MARGLLPYLRVSSAPLPDACELAALLRGVKHARFHDPSVAYHVLLRCFQGRLLLRPDRRRILNRIVAGVIGRARERWPDVRLCAHAWLSNHAHLMIQGPPRDLPVFVGFIEREISRRWGTRIGWPDRMWQRYESTALVGPDSELRAFRYVLAQGAKEHLVASPLHWPGVYCATDLLRGKPQQGSWFDGTSYGRAVQAQRTAVHPNPMKRVDFNQTYEVALDRLPSCRGMSEEEFRAYVKDLVEEIVESAAKDRQGRRKEVLGRQRIFKTSRETRCELPAQPWFEKRRRLIVWADPTRATLEYLQRYWSFQRAFREASRRFCLGEISVVFPPWAFRPSVFVSA